MAATKRHPQSNARRIVHAVHKILKHWPAHVTTALLIVVVIAIAPQQSALLLYKACLPMIGACGGYWLFRFFFQKEPDVCVDHERYQLVALMCAGMLAISLGA